MRAGKVLTPASPLIAMDMTKGDIVSIIKVAEYKSDDCNDLLH
jgi:hypothetical protein